MLLRAEEEVQRVAHRQPCIKRRIAYGSGSDDGKRGMSGSLYSKASKKLVASCYSKNRIFNAHTR